MHEADRKRRASKTGRILGTNPYADPGSSPEGARRGSVDSVRDPSVTSRIMAAVHAKNTRPELALRSYLHAKGLRFRPDLVFVRARIAVFVDGDFWHGAGWKERGLKGYEEQFPSRREWWVAKIARNMERDSHVNHVLESQGWIVIRVFTSQLSTDLPAVADRIINRVRHRCLGARRLSRRSPDSLKH